MEHEFDHPAEPEEKETDHPAEEQADTAFAETQEEQPAAELGHGWGPDLLPLPPAPLPEEIQASKERAELEHEFSGRRGLKRQKQKEQTGEGMSSGQEKKGEAEETGEAEPKLKPTPLPGELASPLDPEEEARMNELIQALFSASAAAKNKGKTEKQQAPASSKEEEEPALEEKEDAPVSSSPVKKEKSRQKSHPKASSPKKEKKEKKRSKVQWADEDEEEEEPLFHRLRQQWNEVESSGGPEGQTGKQKVQALWDHLMDQADEYAQNMYEEEQEEEKPHWADQYIKPSLYDQEGTPLENRSDSQKEEEDWTEEEPDWEEDDRPLPKEKKRRRRRFFRLHEEPTEEELDFEYTPGEVANFYRKRIGRLHFRGVIVGIFALLLCYTAAAQAWGWPFPFAAQGGLNYYVGASLLFLCLASLFGMDVIRDGLKGLFTLKADIELLVAASVIASLLDAITMLAFQMRTETMPFCAVSGVSLFFAMWSRYSKVRTKRMAYRVASLSNPDLITRSTDGWEKGKCFTKHLGSTRGFVTQVESADGVERLYRRLAPLLLLASLLFGLVVAVGKSNPNLFLWSFSAMTAASASFCACFAYSMPYAKITRRLTSIGAALGGWPGVSAAGGQGGVSLGDRELFPAGTVEITDLSVFNSHTEDMVITCAASVVMESGCGLDKAFHELLRRRGMIFRRPEELSQHPSGGFSAVVQGKSVLVGSRGFMQESGIPVQQKELPPYSVFCAIDGRLAGIFALQYRISSGVRRGLLQLLRSRLSLVVTSRDFYVTPQMISRRAKIRESEFSYPDMEERLVLSDPKQDYELPIVAVLVRDGLTPFAEAIVGGRRLRRAVRSGSIVAAINSVLGVLLAFYLTYVQAFSSITVLNLLVFMVGWLVPAVLVARGVNRY